MQDAVRLNSFPASRFGQGDSLIEYACQRHRGVETNSSGDRKPTAMIAVPRRSAIASSPPNSAKARS